MPLTRVISIVPPAQPRRPISKRRWRRRAGPRWLVRRAPHQAISLIRSDLSFGANSLPENLPVGPPVSEARTARPAWAPILQTPTSDKAPRPWQRFVKVLTLCARRSRATTACGAQSRRAVVMPHLEEPGCGDVIAPGVVIEEAA